MEEFMFLGLRLSEGISKTKFFEVFGQDFDFTYGAVTGKLKAEGTIEIDGDTVRLTDLGVDISNRVLAEFLL